MEKKTNKAKFEIFKFFEKVSFIVRLQPTIKLKVIMSYQQILEKYGLLG